MSFKSRPQDRRLEICGSIPSRRSPPPRTSRPNL